MNYFEVYEVKADRLRANIVNSDGSIADPKKETLIDTDAIVEYIVYEYEEDGSPIGEQHYQVGGFYPDPEDALEQIRADHDPSEWQNHNW